MLSGFHACLKAFENNRLCASELYSIVGQFVTTCEFDYGVLYQLTTEEMFPEFVRHMLRCSYDTIVDRSKPVCTESNLPALIVQFLTTLATKNPTLYDIISANTDLSEFVSNHFAKYTELAEIRGVKATEIVPFVKFVAVIANSNHLNINVPSSLQILMTVISVLLDNPQLCAWAAATIAGLKRNSPVAEAYIMALPNLLQIKRSLSILLSSCDACVVCASLSAMVALFSIGTDGAASLRTLVRFLANDTQFFLMPTLSADAIRDVVKKTPLTKEQITTLLMSILTANGMRAVVIYHLLINLSEYHPIIAQIVKMTKYIQKLLVSVINHEEEFIAPCACQLLLSLGDCDAELLAGLRKSDLFIKILEALILAGENKIESFAVLLSMLSPELNKSDVAALAQAADFLFTSFLRAIENNNAFLSLVLFRLLHKCAPSMKGWPTRIKRIVIDTQFPVLVANILQESLDRHVTRGALETVQYFLNAREPEFAELFTSAFLLLGRRKNEEKASSAEQMNSERQNAKAIIDELKSLNKQHESELSDLREAHSQLVSAYNEERRRSEIQSEKHITSSANSNAWEMRASELREENAKLLTKLSEKSTKLKSRRSLIDQLSEENRALKERIIALESAKQNRDDQLQFMERQIKTQYGITEQDFTVRQMEDKLSKAEQTIVSNLKQIRDLESCLHNQQGLNKRLEQELDTVREELLREQEQSQKLSGDITVLQQQNEKYRETQKDIEHTKRKYATKRRNLQAALKEMEEEKRKWESIARFGALICTGKTESTQQVFDPTY